MKDYTTKHHLLTLLLSLVSLTASAYDFEVDGIYYTVTSLSDFTCSVASGEFEGTVVIPPTIVYNGRTLTVTGIEKYAFVRCGEAIRSLTIPNTISSVPDDAFSYCTSLDSLIIQDGDTEIDLGMSSKWEENQCQGPFYNIPISYAYIGRNIKNRRYYYHSSGNIRRCHDQFYNSDLRVAEIGDKVTSMPYFCKSKELEKVILSKESNIEIGDSIFLECSKLSDISEDNNVSKIGEYAFEKCSNLESVSFPNAQAIRFAAFRGCSKLESVSFPNVQTIEESYAFSSCSNLKSVSFPNAQAIGYYVFSGCSSLESVSFPNVQTIDPHAFEECSSLESVSFPNVQTIGYEAFWDCSALKTIDLPQSLESIGNVAFWGTNITDIVIPNRVKVLKDIFPDCIQSITLGNSIESIASDTFKKSGLETINIYTTTPPTMNENSAGTVQYMNVNVNVPVGTKEAYMNADVWKNFWNINEVLPNSIESVADTSADLAFATTSDGIVLSGADGQNVKVYGIGGEEVLSISNYHGQSLSLQKGIYVVKAGKKSIKVML